MSSASHGPWTEENLDNPHQRPDKARRVQAMFEAIAPSYDLNNRLHSLWRDQAWRRAAVRAAAVQPGETVLDVACGTGDLSMAFAEQSPAERVLGVDFTPGMLRVARHKARAMAKAPAYAAGDATGLPLPDACADVASIAFGIRNVQQPEAAVAEFHRVLRPGGRLVILEFSVPESRLLRSLYLFYFHHVLPRTATLIARDRTGAYKYLPRSVNTFLGRDQMKQMMETAGFENVTLQPLTFGIAVLYVGAKRG